MRNGRFRSNIARDSGRGYFRLLCTGCCETGRVAALMSGKGERRASDQLKLRESTKVYGDLIARIKNGAKRRRLEAVCSVRSY